MKFIAVSFLPASFMGLLVGILSDDFVAGGVVFCSLSTVAPQCAAAYMKRQQRHDQDD